MIYDALEHVFFDPIRNAVSGPTIKNQVDKYVDAGKAAKELEKRLLQNEDFLALIASFVQRRLRAKYPNNAGSMYLDPGPWQPGRRRTQPWRLRPALCTKDRLARVGKGQTQPSRRAPKSLPIRFGSFKLKGSLPDLKEGQRTKGHLFRNKALQRSIAFSHIPLGEYFKSVRRPRSPECAKWAKRLHIQMKTSILYPFDTISIVASI